MFCSDYFLENTSCNKIMKVTFMPNIIYNTIDSDQELSLTGINVCDTVSAESVAAFKSRITKPWD